MDIKIIEALEARPVQAKLSFGVVTVMPITVRRLTKLGAMLKEVQGDPKRFRDQDNPDFYSAVADALEAAGDKMPRALELLTGEAELGKREDISLLDLGAVMLAVAEANQASGLKKFFQQATDKFRDKPESKTDQK